MGPSVGGRRTVIPSAVAMAASVPCRGQRLPGKAPARSGSVPPRSGRLPGVSLERAVEGGLRLVADLRGDRGDSLVGIAKELGGGLQAPAREVLDRRLVQEMPEALRKGGSR